MATNGTLSEAFASFGVKGANPRWSWSARSDDGKTVVLALWQDEFEFVKGEKKMIYHGKVSGDAESLQRPGNRERLENLKWAKENCGGIFHVVVVIAKDTQAEVKEIEECFPKPGLRMIITVLDEDTGEFRAESFGGGS